MTALVDLDVAPVLVVAPIRVCETVWAQEASRWAHLQGLSFELLRGSPAARRAALERPATIYLINYELLPWLDDEVDLSSFAAIVWDEVSLLKAPGTVRFKAIRKALERCPPEQMRLGLTGTPVGNSLLNLWGENYVCSGAQPFGTSYVAWRAKNFRPVDRDMFVWRPFPDTERNLRAALKPHAAFLETPAGLPPRIRQVPIPLNKATRALYTELSSTMTVNLAGQDILARGAHPLVGKLRQLCSGAIYTDEPTWSRVHNERDQALIDLLEELEGAPLLVVYEFAHERERIRALCPKAMDVKQRGAIEAWNRGDLPVMTMHPLSGGHGLNLQHGGSDIAFFSLPWSLELYRQSIGRLDRPGQTQAVTVHAFISPATVEDAVWASLNRNARVEAGTLKALQG